MTAILMDMVKELSAIGSAYHFNLNTVILFQLPDETVGNALIGLLIDEGATDVENEERRIILGTSDVFSDTEAFALGYSQALEAIEYMEAYTHVTACAYRQISSLDREDSQSVSENSLLISAVLGGQRQEVQSGIQLLRDSVQEKEKSIFLARYTLFFLYNATLRIRDMMLKQYGSYPVALDRIKSIFSITSLDHAIDLTEELLLDACDFIGVQQQNPQERVVGEVRQYIFANYIDADLNVNMLANVFRMNPAYLSRKYKQETGISIIDEINQQRVKKARELLMTTELKNDGIAQAVGFIDSNALIRVFKKHVGITPGLFRQTRIE